jgi:hypothetical protein
MGRLSTDDLWHGWQQEQIAVEMAMGHVLQHLVAMQHSLDATQHTLTRLRAEIASLRSPPEPPAPAGRRTPPTPKR